MTGEAKKKGGRPPRPQTQGNFTFRTPPELRQWLISEAEKGGRSVSEQITYLLDGVRRNEASSRFDDVTSASLATRLLCKRIARALMFMEGVYGGDEFYGDKSSGIVVDFLVNKVVEDFIHDDRQLPDIKTLSKKELALLDQRLRSAKIAADTIAGRFDFADSVKLPVPKGTIVNHLIYREMIEEEENATSSPTAASQGMVTVE